MEQKNIFFDYLDIKLMIEETLAYLQVPNNLTGYKYLTQAIEYIIRNYNGEIIDTVIPKLAHKLNKNSNQIYGNINNVIKRSWNNLDKFNSINIFNSDSDISPTPNEYIKYISKYLIYKMEENNIIYNTTSNNIIEKISFSNFDYSIHNFLSTLDVNLNDFEYELIKNCVRLNLLMGNDENLFSTLFNDRKEYKKNIQILKEIINRSWSKISLQEKVLVFHVNKDESPIPINYINSITNYIKKYISTNNIDIINTYITNNLKNNCISNIKQNNITNFETKYDKLYEIIKKLDKIQLDKIKKLIKTKKGRIYLEKYLDNLIIETSNINLLKDIFYFNSFSYYEGYQYFNEALFLIKNDESVLESIMKEIYIPIALKYNKSYKSIERSIRTFKIKSFNNMPKKLKNEIFYEGINENPTNKVYLYYIYKYICKGKTKQKTL